MRLIVSTLAFLSCLTEWRSVAELKPTKSIDFIYFSENPTNISVPFSLRGACLESGISAFAQSAILIDRVIIGGLAIEPVTMLEGYRHDEKSLIVKDISPQFRHQMRLSDLVSAPDPGKSERRMFKFSADIAPRTIEVTYRVLCADRTAFGPFVTFGEKMSGGVSKVPGKLAP
ncbi:MAG TPA: hypothetical protein VHJ20_01650 [Polyangia bacterium]|nr:hypothetical protein [Polyangia bacterium]